MSKPTISLDGRRVLVTGGARGLGEAFAAGLVAAGARVVIADVLTERGAATADALGVAFVAMDLASPESIEAAIETTVARLGGLDGLLNNGAIATGVGGRTHDELEVEAWDRVMTVNVRGTWLATRAAWPHLARAGNGKVVNLASDTALWGAPRLMAYVASKGAVIAMTRSMAREMGGDGIAVNAIAPGLVRVEATEYVPEARKQHYVDGRAMNRVQEPEDVVGAALYLLSDAADFVTGQLLPVNGGFVFN